MVSLMRIVASLAEEYADDYVIREGVAHLILGARVLLNADFGTRLDGGSLDAELVAWAERMRYDLDVERFTDE